VVSTQKNTHTHKSARMGMFPSSSEHLMSRLLDLPNGQSFSQSLFPIKLLTLVSCFQFFPTTRIKLAVFY